MTVLCVYNFRTSISLRRIKSFGLTINKSASYFNELDASYMRPGRLNIKCEFCWLYWCYISERMYPLIGQNFLKSSLSGLRIKKKFFFMVRYKDLVFLFGTMRTDGCKNARIHTNTPFVKGDEVKCFFCCVETVVLAVGMNKMHFIILGGNK